METTRPLEFHRYLEANQSKFVAWRPNEKLSGSYD